MGQKMDYAGDFVTLASGLPPVQSGIIQVGSSIIGDVFLRRGECVDGKGLQVS